jgi:hypothetical protein
MVLRTAPSLPSDGMGIVEADEPLAVRAVQGQRIVETVRLLRRDGDPPDDEANPMTAGRVDDQHLAVEVEQDIKGRIARRQQL